MLFLNRVRCGILLCNAYIPLSPCMAASAPTISSQNPTATVALISPSHASGNASFAASQMLHSPLAIKRQFLNTTSNATTASTSTSYEIPSSTTESMVATYGPSRPSNEHIQKLAAIIAPATVLGVGTIAFFPFLYKELELAEWFHRTAGQQAKDWWRAFDNVRELDKLEKADVRASRALGDWEIYMERRILNNQGVEGGPLSPEQMEEIEAVERANIRFSIWADEV